MIGRQKVKVPTRVSIYSIHRLAHYSPRLVFSLGIIQLVSGIALLFLGLVMFRFDREKALSWSISLYSLEPVLPEVVRILCLGVWVMFSAFLTLLLSFRPTLLLVLLLTSLATVALTGVFAIFIFNHVIQNSLLASLLVREAKLGEPPLVETAHLYSRTSPTLFFNVFMLCQCLFCTISFVISIVTFLLVSHHLCSCAGGGKMAAQYQIYDTACSKKERIVQWVIQQSQQLPDQPDLPVHRPDFALSDSALALARKKLGALQSCATNSTKLSFYEC